ncbi:MAG: ComEC/Rec2 family competence protein [Flavobacteriales bacterium]
MNPWKKMPLVRVALPFIVGLFCALELGMRLGVAGIILSFGGILSLGYFHSRLKTKQHVVYYAVLVSIILFCLGSLRGELHERSIAQSRLTPLDLNETEAYLIQLEGKFSEKAKSFKSKGQIIGIYKDNQLIAHDEPTLVYVPKSLISDSLKNAGQIIGLAKPSEIYPPKNPNEFNYKKYLNGLGINYQFYLDSAHLKLSGVEKSNKFLDQFEEFRSSNLQRLKDLGISKRSFSVISALVFGQKDFLSPELYDAYGSAGATHVLAVSGLHVGLIYVILVWLCKGLKRRNVGKLISILIILSGLWSYAAITGFSPSVLRASTMFTFISIAQFSIKGSNIFNTIAASALCLLVLHPNLLMEVGFQLSYSAVLGILIIQPFLYGMLSPGTWILDKAWQISTVSIAAQLGTFPLGMLYFHQFPNYFMISNLFVIPLATLILYLTLTTLAASFIPILGSFLAWLLDHIVKFLNLAIDQMTHLPYARSEGIDISVLECFILYAIITQLVFVFIRKSYGTLKWCLGAVIFFFALQCHEAYTQHTQNKLTIHVIKGERAISIVKGKTCFFLCSERLRKDEAKIKFHVSHYWDHLGIENKETIGLDEYYHCNAFTKTANSIFYKDQVLYLTDKVLYDHKLNAERIVLLDEINLKSDLSSNVKYYADGLTKRKYRLEEASTSEIKLLDYALTLE